MYEISTFYALSLEVGARVGGMACRFDFVSSCPNMLIHAQLQKYERYCQLSTWIYMMISWWSHFFLYFLRLGYDVLWTGWKIKVVLEFRVW